jgi:ribosomal protein L4
LRKKATKETKATETMATKIKAQKGTEPERVKEKNSPTRNTGRIRHASSAARRGIHRQNARMQTTTMTMTTHDPAKPEATRSSPKI